jgi:hypothetical protein
MTLTAALRRVGAQGRAASKRADGEGQLASIGAKTSMSNRRETTQFRWGPSLVNESQTVSIQIYISQHMRKRAPRAVNSVAERELDAFEKNLKQTIQCSASRDNSR